MHYEIVEHNGKIIVELLPPAVLAGERQALDLVAACGENRARRLLLHSASLPAEFFELKTRLAGEVLLKFSNYRIISAAVIPADLAARGRFGEMVLEANRGRQFHVYDNRAAALDWLAGECGEN